MVSTALFVVIVTMGITVILNVNKSHKVSANVRDMMDNINFVMEDMSRNIRIASDLHCDDSTPANSIPVQSSSLEDQSSCISSGVAGAQASEWIAFEGLTGTSGDPNDQIVYQIISPQSGSFSVLRKSRDGGASFSQITTDGVHLDAAKSGFTVYGAKSGDAIQPRAIIRLAGTIAYGATIIPFDVQTSIATRNRESF